MKGIDMVYTYELMICSAIAEYMCDLCVEFVGWEGHERVCMLWCTADELILLYSDVVSPCYYNNNDFGQSQQLKFV